MIFSTIEKTAKVELICDCGEIIHQNDDYVYIPKKDTILCVDCMKYYEQTYNDSFIKQTEGN